jgi:uncharacterized protein (TIGR02231 family)
MKKTLFLLITALYSYNIVMAQDTAKATANLTAATVYFGYGAELTHNAKLLVNTNTKQIIINQLSTNIDVNSLQINVPENVALLSQRFTLFTPTYTVVPNPIIKKYQDTIAIIQKEINRNINLQATEELVLEKTGKLIEITINSTSVKTITSDETLKLVNAYTARIEKSKATIFKINEQIEDLNEKIASFNQKINDANIVPVKNTKSYGQLILQVICGKNEEIPVEFSYFTNTAGFTPMYDVRVNSKTNDIKLVYKAAITQTTGIDWKQTKLTLSTSNPHWNSTAPLLSPWYLQQYVPQLYNSLQIDNYKATNSIQSLKVNDEALNEINTVGYGTKKIKPNQTGAVTTIDGSTLNKYTTLSESQLNTNFEIDLPYNINSDGEVHSVTIKEEKINAILKNYAVPKLDKDAYLLAEIADWQKLDLLPGIANIIMDNTYLGKSSIDPNSTADTLNLSLGKDKRVAIKRSIIKEYTSTKTSGNFTKQNFTYEITVKNNKTTAVDVILKDQYPISNEKEIEVVVENTNEAMVNSEIGVLTWQLKLKPGESIKKRFSYSVKYPKEKRIYNL